jgi:hypothetical protein
MRWWVHLLSVNCYLSIRYFDLICDLVDNMEIANRWFIYMICVCELVDLSTIVDNMVIADRWYVNYLICYLYDLWISSSVIYMICELVQFVIYIICYLYDLWISWSVIYMIYELVHLLFVYSIWPVIYDLFLWFVLIVLVND